MKSTLLILFAGLLISETAVFGGTGTYSVKFPSGPELAPALTKGFSEFKMGRGCFAALFMMGSAPCWEATYLLSLSKRLYIYDEGAWINTFTDLLKAHKDELDPSYYPLVIATMSRDERIIPLAKALISSKNAELSEYAKLSVEILEKGTCNQKTKVRKGEICADPDHEYAQIRALKRAKTRIMASLKDAPPRQK